MYLTLIEQLIRGRCLSKPIEATKLFAKQYQKKLENAGCLGEYKEIIIEKLKDAFYHDKMDYQELS